MMNGQQNVKFWRSVAGGRIQFVHLTNGSCSHTMICSASPDLFYYFKGRCKLLQHNAESLVIKSIRLRKLAYSPAAHRSKVQKHYNKT